jgi:hypothetical protein
MIKDRCDLFPVLNAAKELAIRRADGDEYAKREASRGG